MTSSIWEIIGAIAGVLALIVSIIGEWDKIVKLYTSVRNRSITFAEATKQAFRTVARRAWRPVIVIASVFLIGLWVRSNLMVRLIQSVPNWTPVQYLFATAQIVLLGLVAYILLIEPQLRSRRTARSHKSSTLTAITGGERFSAIPVVFYDGAFPCPWVATPEKAAAYFEERGFVRVGMAELMELMRTTVEQDTAFRANIVFINDIVPTSIVQVRDPTCILRRFLDAGGRVVWWGDIPLHYRGVADQMRETWQGGPIVLSVNHYIPQQLDKRSGLIRVALWSRRDLDGMVQLTEAGRAIGMADAGRCLRPAGVSQDTIIYSEIIGNLGFGEDFEEYRWAISWRKVFNQDYPYSGFMQYPLGNIDCNEIEAVRNYFRFSVSDWPLIPGPKENE